MKKTLRLCSNNGQGLVEYALLLALIAVGGILIMGLLGVSVSDLYCRAVNGITGGAACKAQSTYCQDNFDGNTSAWQNLSGTPPTSQNGQMCFSGYMQNMNKCSAKMTQSDYVINLNGVTITQGNGYGVYFRATLVDNKVSGYAFQYDPGAGNVLLIRPWVEGAEVITPIARVPINSTIYNVPHNFKIVVKGNTFTVFMDGAQVMTAQDGAYPTGGVGLRSWDSTYACANDFSIGQP
jgi:Flp pilus assembly pilin Flp